MKFFVAFAALVALTVAVPLGKPVDNDLAQLEAIIAAINSPSTDPATAALLEEQLAEIIAAVNPIAVGPAIIPPGVVADQPEPIAVGPAIIPHPVVIDRPEPIAVGPAIIPHPVQPSPVVVGDIPAGSSPLVQIIVNVNKASPAVVPVSPIAEPEPIGRPEPIGQPIIVPGPIVAPLPIVRPEPIPQPIVRPEPIVQIPVEPVQIGVPIIPEAAVVLPEELN